MTWEVRQGDALERLREMPDGSVQTCVTSPPYFGLRDYGTGAWEGGDEACAHVDVQASEVKNRLAGSHSGDLRNKTPDVKQTSSARATVQHREVCTCGARRVDDQVGLEPTPDEYVQRLVEVFREVRRVLRDDGTLWLNLGDSYAAARSGHSHEPHRGTVPESARGEDAYGTFHTNSAARNAKAIGMKHKDLLGIPWMVALALRADGWYLRSDIIWAKPNPMPESVTDRPTKSHEYVFLLSKGPRYFYDADAVREEHSESTAVRAAAGYAHGGINAPDRNDAGHVDRPFEANGRNKRSVWTIATQPFPGAHFAVFPPKLIEPCVLAGSSETACGVCAAPWERVVEGNDYEPSVVSVGERGVDASRGDKTRKLDGKSPAWKEAQASRRTVGWQSTCEHQDNAGTSTVLDPFSGAGTTGLVATRLDRSYIGIELNPEYAEMSRERIRDDQPLMNYLSEAS